MGAVAYSAFPWNCPKPMILPSFSGHLVCE
jgi:hypothetical protein